MLDLLSFLDGFGELSWKQMELALIWSNYVRIVGQCIFFMGRPLDWNSLIIDGAQFAGYVHHI